ncbi:AAA family ATPase [Streptomyces sp. NPDC092296]|uniref:helix-turn-helix transcriptional regulator n=1 Tax=Streptomyces sp. NPDC092296 TaxID=3366012 RepID=UPI0037FFB936
MAVTTVTTIAGPHTGVTVRVDESRRLGRLVRTARQGHPLTAELAGDPGAGKTRLLTALAHQGRAQGLTVLRGCGSEAENQVPFHPFVQALTTWQASTGTGSGGPEAAALLRALTDGGAAVRDSAEPAWRLPYFAELRRLLAGLLAAIPEGLLLLLDDFHWSDTPSLRLLETLIRRPVDGGLAIAVAHRPRQAPVSLRAALQQGAELGTVDSVELGPLTPHQCAELLGTGPDTPDLARLHQRSDGNPLYLTALAETASVTHDALGRWTGSGLGARLLAETALLGEVPRKAVQSAAVLGGVFDAGAVAEVAEISRDEACRALAELCGRDLVRAADGPEGYAFRHPLLRCCLYAATDPCWRAGAHRRALDRLGRSGAPALELAPHIERSGAGTRPSDGAVLAAATRAAVHLGRPAEGARWLTSALRLRRRTADPVTADPVTDGAATVGAATVGAATGTATGVTAPGPLDAELWKSVVRALAAEGDAERMATLAREILAGPLGPGEPQLCGETRALQEPRVSAVTFLSTALAATGHEERAQALITAELPAGPGTAPDAWTPLQLQQQLGKILAGKVPARTDVETLLPAARRADPVTRAGALVISGLTALLDGDMCAAERSLESGAHALDELAADRPAGEQECAYLLTLSWTEALMGWYGPAHGHAERALTAARKRGDTHLLAPLLATLGYVHYQTGRLADALDAVREGGAVSARMGRTDHAHLSDAIAAAAWAQLGHASAPTPFLPQLPAAPAVARTPLNALLLAEAALASGEADTALALLLPERDALRVSQPVAVLAARDYELLAAAAVQAGVGRENLDAWAEHAAAAAAACGLAEQSGHALLARGHALLGRRQPTEAARCYKEAQLLFGSESPAGARARELARSAVRATDRGPESVLGELTLREREVAELAGAGLKTKDIAGRLRVSPRTVDVHLTRIYNKLGVTSRAGLVRLMTLAS